MKITIDNKLLVIIDYLRKITKINIKSKLEKKSSDV